MSPTFAASTFALHWTGITYFSFRFVDQNLLGGSSRHKRKDLSLRTNVLVFLSIILKELGRVILGALAKIGGRQVGFNPAFFQAHHIGHCSILGIANSQLWLDLPP